MGSNGRLLDDEVHRDHGEKIVEPLDAAVSDTLGGHRPARGSVHANPPGLRIHGITSFKYHLSPTTSLLCLIIFSTANAPRRAHLTEAACNPTVRGSRTRRGVPNRRRKSRTRSRPREKGPRRGGAEELHAIETEHAATLDRHRSSEFTAAQVETELHPKRPQEANHRTLQRGTPAL